MPNLFSKTARWYDAIYRTADHTGMADTIVTIAADRFEPHPVAMLDVACGTGHLLECLAEQKDWHLEGLDADPAMLEVARERLPGTVFHERDMAAWSIDRQFDIITCLGSSLAATGAPDRLASAFACMARHLTPGGIVLFDEFFATKQWQPGTLSAIFVDERELKIARMSTSERRDNLAILNMSHLVATPDGIEHITERHELGLSDMDDYRKAFAAAGLREVTSANANLTGVFTNRGTHLLEQGP